ncbi:hypothetical protein HMPREF9244_01690 [Alloscardovia omnicolens F0580]|uniref:Tat pathway signal sequence domain protein n=1 Tax=Alloscardovia omnicolens F0580 TaxID=1321816 RepID=U1SG44_9BIFI|nr:hypothetical protein [Alloscardovia omnicolens]ERH29627.1 hypothetical protein HMPREF9244_01690 [Alloscardovia omnicolens F0580]
MARHKHLNIKIRQGLVKTMAVGVAASTLFGGVALAADGGGGSTGGNTGSGNYTSRVHGLAHADRRVPEKITSAVLTEALPRYR